MAQVLKCFQIGRQSQGLELEYCRTSRPMTQAQHPTSWQVPETYQTSHHPELAQECFQTIRQLQERMPVLPS
jgi:hypothetical protein